MVAKRARAKPQHNEVTKEELMRRLVILEQRVAYLESVQNWPYLIRPGYSKTNSWPDVVI